MSGDRADTAGPIAPNKEQHPAEFLLSAVEEQYLKRELLRLELDYEVEQLADWKNIGIFGYPFAQKSAGGQAVYADGPSAFPLLYHVFIRYVKTFPFLADAADVHFWQQRVQPFIESFASKDISSTADRVEATKRRRLALKLKKLVLMYAAAGARTARNDDGPGVRIERDRAETSTVKHVDLRSAFRHTVDDAHFVNGYAVSVVGVRSRTVRRGFLSDTKWEYLVKSQIEGAPPVYVARTYDEFVTLDKKLRKEFPGKIIPRLPARHKKSSVVAEGDDDDDDDDETDANSATSETGRRFRLGGIGKRPVADGTRVPRERQRITLRAYLHSLVKSPMVVKSSALLEFLFKDRIKELSKREQADVALRKRLDLMRLEDQVRFFEIATERAHMLEGYMAEFKAEIVKKDGLRNMFIQMKKHDRVEAFTPVVQKFVEWCTIEFAATLYSMFVGSDSSPETFSQVKKIHAMMPYAMIRGILKLTNPMAIMKGLMDLFLAQPFGRRSLLQNMFWVMLADEIKAQEKVVQELVDKIGSDDLVRPVMAYVNARAEVHTQMHGLAEKANVDIVVAIFRWSSTVLGVPTAPGLAAEVEAWYRDWNRVVEADMDVQGTLVPGVAKFSQLKDLLALSIRKRDKDMMQQFWADKVTIDLIKEVLTVFYGPLMKLFKAANLQESVADFQAFVDDLIKTVDAVGMDGKVDANRTVQSFIDLTRMHRNSLFRFFHRVYAKDDGLMEAIMLWIGSIMDFLREGHGSKRLDVEGLLRDAANAGEVDASRVVGEMQALHQWIAARKALREKAAAAAAAERRRAQSNEAEPDWLEAMPSMSLDTNDFGFSQANIDFDAADDDDADADASDDDDTEALTLDPIEAERRSRARLQRAMDRAAALPPRPPLTETLKLLPWFQREAVRYFA